MHFFSNSACLLRYLKWVCVTSQSLHQRINAFPLMLAAAAAAPNILVCIIISFNRLDNKWVSFLSWIRKKSPIKRSKIFNQLMTIITMQEIWKKGKKYFDHIRWKKLFPQMFAICYSMRSPREGFNANSTRAVSFIVKIVLSVTFWSLWKRQLV